VERTAARRPGDDPALDWSRGLQVPVGGRGVIAHAGVVLPRLLADRVGLLLADRVGLTLGLRGVLARRGFVPGRVRGRLLTDTVAALVAGATCLPDVEALTRQEALFEPRGGASDTTLLRGLSEVADQLGADGLPGRRLTQMLAAVRKVAWAQVVAGNDGQLPAVTVAGQPLTRPADAADEIARGVGPAPVTVLRIDATIIESATLKPGVAGHYKGGIGYHPLTGWCSNVGDNVAGFVASDRPQCCMSDKQHYVKSLGGSLSLLPPPVRCHPICQFCHPIIQRPHAGELGHRVPVGLHRLQRHRLYVLRGESVVAGGDGEAGRHPLQVVLEGARQGLVEVVEAEHQLPLG
jgi:hypothetical protein